MRGKKFLARALSVAILTGSIIHYSRSLDEYFEPQIFNESPQVIEVYSEQSAPNVEQSIQEESYANKILEGKAVEETRLAPERLEEKIDSEEENEKMTLSAKSYNHLDGYDSLIKKNLDEFNRKLKPNVPLDVLTVKAQIQVETGGKIQEWGFCIRPFTNCRRRRPLYPSFSEWSIP